MVSSEAGGWEVGSSRAGSDKPFFFQKRQHYVTPKLEKADHSNFHLYNCMDFRLITPLGQLPFFLYLMQWLRLLPDMMVYLMQWLRLLVVKP